MSRPWFVKRQAVRASAVQQAARLLGAVLAATLVGLLLFLPFDVNPLQAYWTMLSDAFFTVRGLSNTLNKTAPLILVGLATVVAWRAGFGYLGFEGCLLLGAVASTSVALQALPGGPLAAWPLPLLVLVCAMAAFLVGGVWAGVVAWLRVRYGGNEVLMSLMSNYLAVFLLQYLVSGPLRAPGDLPQSARLPISTWLPYLWDGGRAHAGILLALTAALLVWHTMKHLRIGYEWVVVGLNPRAASYGGIPVGRRIMLAAFFSGGLAALAGISDVLGSHHRLLDGMSEGVGFVGMVVALLGKLSAAGVAVSAFLYAGMTVGADSMQRQSQVPSSVVVIVQCLIILFVLASALLDRYRWVGWRRTATPQTREGG